jgi:hypothetical protein
VDAAALFGAAITLFFPASFLGFEKNTSVHANMNQERSLRSLAGLKPGLYSWPV